MTAIHSVSPGNSTRISKRRYFISNCRGLILSIQGRNPWCVYLAHDFLLLDRVHSSAMSLLSQIILEYLHCIVGILAKKVENNVRSPNLVCCINVAIKKLEHRNRLALSWS